MIALLYLLRSRWRRLLFFTHASAALTLLLLVPALRGGDPSSAFAYLTLLLPLLWGGIFAALLHDAMHRPFALLLPNFGRRVVPAFAALTAGFAIACGWAGYVLNPEIPLLTACAVAAAAFSLSLPGETSWSRARSGIPLLVGGLGTLLIFTRGAQLRAFVIAAPLTTTFVAAAVIVICFRAAFSRPRRRARALETNTSFLSAVFLNSPDRQKTPRRFAASHTASLKWSTHAEHGTLWWWLAALRHERANEWGRLGWFCTVLLASAATVLTFAGMSRTDGSYATKVLALATNESGARSSILTFVLLIQVLIIPLPRSAWLYPLSRAVRTQVTFASFVVHLGTGFTIFLGTALATALAAAAWLDRDFAWTGFLAFGATVASMLPIAPFVLWARLHHEVRNTRAWLVVALGASLFAAPGLVAVLWGATHLTPALLSWSGFARWMALTGLSQALLLAALRRFHRKGDFVQSSASDISVGLV